MTPPLLFKDISPSRAPNHQAFTGSTACGNIPKGAKVFPSKTTFLEAGAGRQLMMVGHKAIVEAFFSAEWCNQRTSD